MSHMSMFKKSNNEEGYIMIICHRERYRDELESLGFVDSSDKLEVIEPVKSKVNEPTRDKVSNSKKTGKGKK